MKKRAMTLGLALFCAFLLCGCQRTTPAAPAQEAAPEPEAAEETVLLLEEPVPVACLDADLASAQERPVQVV